MKKSPWFTALAAALLLLGVSADTARAQYYYAAPPAPYFVYPGTVTTINRAPAYGPYYGQGLSFIQPFSTSVSVFPSYTVGPAFPYTSSSFSTYTPSFSYYSPTRSFDGYRGHAPVLHSNPMLYQPVATPFTSPLLYRGR
jgi:hypothetical protein